MTALLIIIAIWIMGWPIAFLCCIKLGQLSAKRKIKKSSLFYISPNEVFFASVLWPFGLFIIFMIAFGKFIKFTFLNPICKLSILLDDFAINKCVVPPKVVPPKPEAHYRVPAKVEDDDD